MQHSCNRNAGSKDDLWKTIPLPSIADASEQHVTSFKTLLECCRCVKAYNQEYELEESKEGSVGITNL